MRYPGSKHKADLIHLLAFDWWYYRQRKRNDSSLRNSPRDLMEWKKRETVLSLFQIFLVFLSKKVYLIACHQQVWVVYYPQDLTHTLLSSTFCTCRFLFSFHDDEVGLQRHVIVCWPLPFLQDFFIYAVLRRRSAWDKTREGPNIQLSNMQFFLYDVAWRPEVYEWIEYSYLISVFFCFNVISV